MKLIRVTSTPKKEGCGLTQAILISSDWLTSDNFVCKLKVKHWHHTAYTESDTGEQLHTHRFMTAQQLVTLWTVWHIHLML